MNVAQPTTPPARFRLHTVEDIEQLPPPRWLLQDLIPAESFVLLFGPPGDGKSFIALDWAVEPLAVIADLPPQFTTSLA